MPETKAQRSEAARKAAATRKRHATERKAVDRTEQMSDEVLKSVEAGQRAAIEAVKKFVDLVDQKLPAGEHPSRRQEIIDGAMEMSDRLVHTQYDFIRKVVHSAGKALGSKDGKE
jgi:hypothetical protein